MKRLKIVARRLAGDEAGHGEIGIVGILAIAAAVLLAWGIVDETDGLVIAGAAVVAVATIAVFFFVHNWVVAILGRLDELERR